MIITYIISERDIKVNHYQSDHQSQLAKPVQPLAYRMPLVTDIK